MERWQSSPPEHEPAAASDIARAVESNGGIPLIDDGQYSFDYRDSAAQSWYNTSSASSAGTSVCGFCGLKMNTWEERVDHLAAHYKEGRTMACWQGDWGLDDRHLRLLENAIPPYLIDYERSTPAPFGASQTPYGSPTTAYELIKIELDHSMQTHFDLSGRMPDNSSMQLEACRIIFASDVTSTKHDVPSASWLRDLIMACQPITNEAKFGPLRLRNECRFSTLKINGRDNIFELCPLEAQLWTFVKAKEAVDVAVTDENIQEEASKIVTYMEQISKTPSDVFANWLIKLIHADTGWLQGFKMRACSTTSGPAPGPVPQISGLSLAYASAPIERPLPLRMETNVVGLGRLDPSRLDPSQMETFLLPFEKNLPNVHLDPATYHLAKGPDAPQDEANLFPPARSRMFINSANFFSWLVRDLARWVAATMSPNNPNCHVPTDEELQHQARCIVYDDDDPWNQTAADNAQWLRQFKRDVGILNEPNDPNESNLSGLYSMRHAL
ncbi:hypothetical protein E8E12_006709 [Didymella heteroderae]|uniref:C2H2-type domain-containing protein n=1 Tax=Didymella heteroderae TaxID=1769908 RepID=A0A9P5C0G2_9PLEO|nr:hypothetical protein E8E12_006709 [Didymella heteroderae]